MNAQQMIEKYYIALASGGKIQARPVGKLTPAEVAAITAAKPEIIQILAAQKAEKEAASQAREAAIAEIPGLEILRSAIDAKSAHYHAVSAAMEDEQNDGVRMPARPTADTAALAREYPVAALWLRSEAYLCAANDRKYSAGVKAQALILAGEIEKARDTMENWLPSDLAD